MGISLSLGLVAAAGQMSMVRILLVSLLFSATQGVSFTPVPPPGLDLGDLGRIALAGDFDAISLYTYQGQNENAVTTNGSQSLLSQMSNGGFATLISADASIVTMCPFILKDGTLAGVIIGGNFTSLGGIEAQGIALFDPSATKITPLPGLTGQVTALLCDQSTSTVYVGGDFKGGNSTNAIAWVGSAGWTNLPFAGFNGPVRTIAKAPGGNVLFGGSFTGLVNTTAPTVLDQQVINLSTAKISTRASTEADGFSDPRNVICKANGQDGAGNTWLLEDDTPGFWRADMNFGYEPTKLRVWNTRQDGRGTKTFRFTAFPIDGILNMTYTDPVTNQIVACDARCHLSDDPSIKYQDFKFVNVIGMNGFQIDVSDWYGNGGGLDGIELFQDEIYAYAVPDLNEPSCVSTRFGSNATVTGPWARTPSGQSGSDYLTVNLSGPSISSDAASVVFQPDIKQSGSYIVTIFTPGCQQDNSCSARGIANVTGDFATGTKSTGPTATQIYQTNDFDKYDQIYSGYVEANSGAFRPTVTLSPISSQANDISLVAQRVHFQLQGNPDSSGDLNGLFEFNPNQATINMDFSNSTIDAAGANLTSNALITSVVVVDGVTYIAGKFSTAEFQNIFSIADVNSTALAGNGLNGAVTTTFLSGNLLYIGGDFNDTSKSDVPGLSSVAVFDTSRNVWQPLGRGVNGRVNTIVPLTLNITNSQPETCVSINGNFDQVLASGSDMAFPVSGLAIWVPSQNNWLHNLETQTLAISGKLSAATNVSGSSPLLAGTLVTRGMSASDAVELSSSSGALSLNPLGVRIQPQQVRSSSMRKRAVSGQNVTGAVTGLFDNSNGRNITIIGGHFTATATNGSTINNLAFINTTSSGKQTVAGIGSGLNADSVFLALATQADTLYAGGTVSGTLDGADINGLVLWDLARANYASPQAPPLSGNNVAVNAIATRPNSAEVYVAGNFDSAGSLGCPSICTFNNGQWSRPGTGLGGSVASLTWQGTDKLLVGGNLTINNNATSLANYDAKNSVWTSLNGAAGNVPGPVTALSPADSVATSFWVAGKSSNGSAFLMKYDGTNFRSIGDVLGKQTTIRGLSMLSLSQSHANNDLVDPNMVLLLTGQLNLPTFGNASAALFNGTAFSPFILSTSGNGPGSLSQIFTEKRIKYNSPGRHLRVIFVVLIGLAIGLACIFLLVAGGLIIERRRRKNQANRPTPNNYFEKTSNMERIPPEHLFSRLGRGRGASAVSNTLRL